MKPIVTSKQIWQLVFRGDVDQAVDITRQFRGSIASQSDLTVTTDSALLFDVSLSSNSGHQLSIAHAYEDMAHAIGYRFLAKHAYHASIAPEQHWQPYFLVQHHTLAFRAIQTRQELRFVNAYFEREYVDAIILHKPQLCIFTTTRFLNVLAAAKAVASQHLAKPTRLIFTVFESDDAPDCDDPGIIRLGFSEAASILMRHKIPYIISVETDQIREFLVSCGFHPDSVRIYEYIAAKRITEGVVFNQDVRDRVRIGFLGGSRPVRNPELIADLLIEQNYPEIIQWCVQLDLEYLRRMRGEDTVRKIIDMHKQGRIELHTNELNEHVYRTLFCSLDIIVMPYSERYEKIGSGILCEAVYAGVIPIIPERSSMNSLYSSLGGEAPTFQKLSSADVLEAITDGINRFTELKHRTTRIRENWCRHPSSAKQWRRDMVQWISDQSGDRD